MTIGTVKFFDSARGIGFVTPDDGSEDVFVHVSEVENSGLGYLSAGQKIEFDIEPDGRGAKAVNLFAVDD